MKIFHIAVAALLLWAMAAAAQQVGSEDKTFVEKAAKGGMAEVEFAALAEKRAQSEAVKEFAQHMREDHSKANEQLQAIASEQGVSVPKQLDEQHKNTEEKLSRLSGKAFDRQYMQVQVEDHQKTVDLFERQAKQGENPELRQFAEQKLPALRKHLERAKEVASKVEAGE